MSAIQKTGPADIPIFLDGKNPFLDAFKLSEKDPQKVIVAVGLNAARTVILNYAQKYAPHLLPDLKQSLNFTILVGLPPNDNTPLVLQTNLIKNGKEE